MVDFEKEIRIHVESDMEHLENIMKSYGDMRGAYAYKKANELHQKLAQVLTALDK